MREYLAANQTDGLIGAAREQVVSKNLTFTPKTAFFPNLNKFPIEERGKHLLSLEENHEFQLKSRSLPRNERSCFARSRLIGRRLLFACETKRTRLQCDPIKGEGQERKERISTSSLLALSLRKA